MAINPFFEYFESDRIPFSQDPDTWPEEWKKIRWKSYFRYPKINLPAPKLPPKTLEDSITKRKSNRSFSPTALSAEDISNLLFYSCGIVSKEGADETTSRRAYPSGGNLHPIEAYLLVLKDSATLPAGNYHYNVWGHYLEKLPDVDIHKNELFRYSWAMDAPAILVFSFIQGRNAQKYGSLAYKLGILEGGHIGQNVYLVSTAVELNCCALGGMDTEKINALLGLDGIEETAFYAIALGKPNKQ